MFTKAILSVAAAVAFATSALAAPTMKRSSFSPISFNNWGGFDQVRANKRHQAKTYSYPPLVE